MAHILIIVMAVCSGQVVTTQEFNSPSACEAARAWVVDNARPVAATVALANKLARIVWAVLVHKRPYEPRTVV